MSLIKLKCNSCDGIFGTSLDVRFHKECDNRCGFCIEQNGEDSLKQNLEEMIKSTLKSDRQTVLILGGEPFLNPVKLLRYVQEIRPYKEKIYITTSLPNSFNKDPKTCCEILDLIDGLNISTNHYNSKINNKIFNASSEHDRISMIGALCQLYADKIRVSINLVKGQIDTDLKLKVYYEVMRDLGVKHIKINELQNCPELYISYEDITREKLNSPFSTGCQTEKIINGIRTTLKRSCFIVEDSKQASFKDFIKIIYKKIFTERKSYCKVLYESGYVSNGWRSKKETL